MRISDLLNHRIGILGLGREGQATINALRRAGYAGVIHVFSDQAGGAADHAELHVGDAAIPALGRIDVLIRSPGFRPTHPIRVAADARGLLQTTATNLFLAELRHAGLMAIGITGSKGKSTTSTLVHLTLAEAGVPCVLVGNIGRPALDELHEVIRQRLVTVIELSSYQCADLVEGPNIACLLDLFPEHLDWHGSLEAYYEAKARIASTQHEGDEFRYNARSGFLFKDRPLRCHAEPINTITGLHWQDGWFCRGHERLFEDTDMILPGVHNRENAVAALAVAEVLGAQPEHLRAVLKRFSGLPFRLQDEGMHQGIRWINDSLSTAPEAAAAALQAFAPRVTTLIAGGFDRGYDPQPLVRAAVDTGVRTLILLPETGSNIAQCAREMKTDLVIIEVRTLDEAVAAAKERTPADTVCLFSPGAPSYNQYASFEERGKHFQTLIA